jgi:hypothetical protein
VTQVPTPTRPLTDGERAFVDRIGGHYAADGFPLDSGRVLGWLIISDTPEQSAAQIAERLEVSRETVDAVSDQLVPATLLHRRDDDDDYYLSLRDDAWPRVVSHTFAGWPDLHAILYRGCAALADEPAARSTRVASMERLFAYLAAELPAVLQRYQQPGPA